MSFIIKINTYYNDKGIELQEEELLDGELPKGRTQYTAMVNIPLIVDGEQIAHQVTVKFHAIGYKDAFVKAVPKLKQEITKLENEVKKLKDDAPRIITSGG